MQGKRLTERQAQTLEAIRDHIRRHGEPPSRSELAKALGLKHQTAVDTHLQALQRKAWIELVPGTARGIRILRDELRVYEFDDVPIVPAGNPMLAEEPQPQLHTMGRLLCRFEQTPDYFVVVRGDSMDRTGIKNGDIVAVRRNPDPREGDMVIARIGTDITLKRYHRGEGVIELQPESTNTEHQTMRMDPETDFEIVGVVVGAIIGTQRDSETFPHAAEKYDQDGELPRFLGQ